MKAILFIGHGTRLQSGQEEMRAFIQNVMRRLDVPIQEFSFLELMEPSIEEGFKRCIDRGAVEIDIVPLFLIAAGHIKQDIPRMLSLLQDQYPYVQVNLKDPFGVHSKILDAMTELVKGAAGNRTPLERVLIVGRGSSDPGMQRDFSAIANSMKERLAVEQVSVCYMAAAEPSLQDGLRTITEKAGGSMVIIPYLLFPGRLLAEIDRQICRLRRKGCHIIHTGPLSRHRVIEDLIVERATGAF